MYGLLPVSAEESIAVEFLVDRPDVVITVIDAANLERSVHLVAQIAELGLRQVVACQHVRCRRTAWRRDRSRTAGHGPSASRSSGPWPVAVRAWKRLREAAARAMDRSAVQPLVVDYGPVIERYLSRVWWLPIVASEDVAAVAPAHWMAVQLVAGDEGLADRIGSLAGQ